MKHTNTHGAAVAMDAFFTRKASSAGVKLPLVTPDGEETEHYLIVRGIDSDEFQRADAKARSAMLEQMRRNKEKGIATTDGNLEDHKLTIVSSLIAEWSFNEPCTEPNIRKFLTEAPQIREEVDRFAVDRRRFFKKPSQG